MNTVSWYIYISILLIPSHFSTIQFAYHGGIGHIRDNILYTENITLQELTALFQPFSSCDEYILPTFFKVKTSFKKRVYGSLKQYFKYRNIVLF